MIRWKSLSTEDLVNLRDNYIEHSFECSLLSTARLVRTAIHQINEELKRRGEDNELRQTMDEAVRLH